MNINLSNKVIVITGASKGLGSILAKSFAKENAKVILNYFHSKKEALQVFEEVCAYNDRCMLIKADISKKNDIEQMYSKIIMRYGYIDILINNAGICNDNFVRFMSEKQWEDVINLNLTGLFYCCQIFSQIMIKQKFGKIINIASIKGQEGSEQQANYAASKAGVIALTKTLAKELAYYNIAVNAVCPGFVVTDLNRKVTQKKELAIQKSLLPITTNKKDFINFVKFISSDCFLGSSGQIYNIDSRIR